MNQMIRKIITGLLCIGILACPVLAADRLVPVGQVIGLELASGTVTVAAYDDSLTAARDAGLKIGDEILEIDGNPITCAGDIRSALNRSDGTVCLTVSRGGREHVLTLVPAVSAEGPKMGVFLRQGITGIGTVTFYDPDTGRFGTLGHGVNDPDGDLLSMTTGMACCARIVSVQKGKAGTPGQLKGALDGSRPLGKLERNTARGVFGKSAQPFAGDAIEVAAPETVQPGPATIRSTVDDGGPRDYSVEILKIYPLDRSDGRNLLLRVTDPALLSATGGIIQGMSGSPIIQNGKLVGAVTHVLVNDPTRGYGIFIENMLDAAS